MYRTSQTDAPEELISRAEDGPSKRHAIGTPLILVNGRDERSCREYCADAWINVLMGRSDGIGKVQVKMFVTKAR